MSRRSHAFIALGLAVVLFFAFNILTDSALRQARLDLTENGLFTLDPGTVKTIESLAEPITLRFYYSEQVATGYPQIASHARRVRDLLDALASRAKGKIRLDIVKPEPYSPAEDRAIAAGITGIPTSTGETIYFGLEGTNLADGHETIPYLSPDRENLLEYDLVSLIDRLNRLKKPVLGIMGDLPLAAGPGGAMAALQGRSKPYRIYSDLEAKFEIDSIGDDADRIPAPVDVLMVVHPARLSPQALYAIDQFVLGGGHALLFVDPLSELALESAQGAQDAPASSSLDPLLQAWGVVLPKGEVVGDRTLAQRVMVDETSRRVVDFIPWLGLTASEISREDPVTAEINQVDLGTAGHIERLKTATTTLIPLLASSEDAMILNAEALQTEADPEALLRNFRPSGVRYTLAARITGPVKTAFPGGPPAPPGKPGDSLKKDGAPPAPPLTQAKAPINVILIADTDIFDDRLWLQNQSVLGQQVSIPTANNGDFVLNAADNLSGSNALLSLRGRQVADRRFTLVEALRRDAEQRYLAEEDRLNRKIAETQRNLEALQRPGGEQAAKIGIVVTPEQRAEIERFRQELSQTRSALRAVQHNLRRDIDALGGVLKLINIALMPLLVAGIAFVYAVIKRRRRAKRAAEEAAP
jgi:gliding motility-associatede transport system auxiliary component